MLKFGICSEDTLRDDSRQKGFWGDPKNIAIDLYGTAKSEELAEKVLNRFTDKTRVYKRTYDRRFEAFDEEVVRFVSGLFSGVPLTVYDLGVSDARTSVDFYRRLISVTPSLQFYAMDFDPEVIVLQDGKTRVIVNDRLELLQIVRPPFVFNVTNPDSYRLYPLNHAARYPLQYLIAPRILRKYRENKLQNFRKLTLFCKRAVQLAEEDQRFRLTKQNVLESFQSFPQAMIVRAMNLFNSDNFSVTQIHRAMVNILDALAPGGLFVTGSNQEPNSAIDGAIYQKIETGFSVIWTSGKGSPVDAFIAAIRTP